MYSAPRNNELTQGTIFSCAYAEGYKETPVYGVIITARCDAAQDKAPIYNFIPVVSLEDWVLNDGAEIILKRVRAEVFGKQKGIIVQAGLSESLMRTKSAKEIVDGHLAPKAAAEKKFKQQLDKFEEYERVLLDISTALSAGLYGVELIKEFPRHVDGVIKELAGNKLTGYYLLREMPSLYKETKDHVALLREVHHVPRALALKIMKGIDVDEWSLEKLHEPSKCPVFIGDEDLCIPVARLQSPWVEHLMQSWTLLFSRIGIDDIDASSVRKSLMALGI